MRALRDYLTEYSESHQNPKNRTIHNICVPAIMWSLMGVLACFHAAEAVALLSLLYYLRFKNTRVVFAMAITSGLMLLSYRFIPNLLATATIVFVAAWIGQFYGHKIEGKKPSFLKDLQFLLIGPVWVLDKSFPRFFGIS